jgi:sugar O-acyltransferase (sialic acid O-acetyltransferase NeuD family)
MGYRLMPKSIQIGKGIAMKKIVLYGAGGFGKEVASIIESINRKEPRYELLGYVDDGQEFIEGMTINGYPWLGKGDWVIEHKDSVVCTCTIGFAHTKANIQRKLTEQGVIFETIISPYAGIAKYSEIGPGCVLYRGVGISVNCKIGAGVLLNDGVTIGHDAVIGDYTTVMPGTGISGAVRIGTEVSIGGHAFIVPERKIGDGATVAAGSIVFTNVRAGTTVLGNPARRMKELE